MAQFAATDKVRKLNLKDRLMMLRISWSECLERKVVAATAHTTWLNDVKQTRLSKTFVLTSKDHTHILISFFGTKSWQQMINHKKESPHARLMQEQKIIWSNW